MAKDPGILNAAQDHIRSIYDAGMEQARGMQKGPIGTRPRSGQEEAALWRRMAGLPKPEFDTMMDAMSQKHGVETMFAFLKKHAGKK